MSDKDFVGRLVEIGSNVGMLRDAQSRSARKLLDYDGEIYPSDGCAITLSTLMQDAGIAVKDVFKAIKLAELLEEKRGWKRIAVGEQKTGDVGSTCGAEAQHGVDHIYLVVLAVNPAEMIVADNQQSEPHTRFISGHGKSATRFFLRAT